MTQGDRPSPEPLKGFIPRPAPPDLRRRVLAAAEGVRPVDRFLAPAQWAMAVACVLFSLVALAGDSILARKQAGRLEELQADRRAPARIGETERTELEEIVGVEAARTIRLQTNRSRPIRFAPKEGWAEGIDSDLLVEDADVHAKNPR